MPGCRHLPGCRRNRDSDGRTGRRNHASPWAPVPIPDGPAQAWTVADMDTGQVSRP